MFDLVGLIARFSNPEHAGQSSEPTLIESGNDIFLTEGMAETRQTQRRLDPDQILKLIAEYLQGQSVAQISRSWQIHRTTVMDHLDRQDIKTRAHKRKMTDNQVRAAAKRYRAGQSLARLGKHYNVDPKTIAKELRQAGVTIRPKGRWG